MRYVRVVDESLRIMVDNQIQVHAVLSQHAEHLDMSGKDVKQEYIITVNLQQIGDRNRNDT